MCTTQQYMARVNAACDTRKQANNFVVLWSSQFTGSATFFISGWELGPTHGKDACKSWLTLPPTLSNTDRRDRYHFAPPIQCQTCMEDMA